MTDQTKDQTPTRASIATGNTVAAFVPQDVDQAFRLAKAFATQGRGMVPQAYEGKEGAVFLAMSKGAELGLSPLAAMQCIAPINGRATVWGDALPGLVQRAGHWLEEWIEGEGDKMVAHCKLIRKDGKETTRKFSVQDAKTAGLWGKNGPWKQYPARMLAMRARGFCVRDGAADVMMGLSVREEVEDYRGPERAKDVTPEGYVSMADKMRQRAESAPVEPEDVSQDPDDHAQPDAAPEPSQAVEDAEQVDPDAALGVPGSGAWTEGMEAHAAGAYLSQNPHTGQDGHDWAGGWEAADSGQQEAGSGK